IELNNFLFSFVSAFSYAYEKADTKLKRKLLSSIFEEKLVFENENYRTPKFNPAFNEIYTNMKKIEGFEIKKGDTFESISRGVEGKGFEPSISFRPIHTFQACSFNHSDTPL
ncbi:MAG: hypothetical protein RIR51_1150, partial [Bacteroidota bacterium]